MRRPRWLWKHYPPRVRRNELRLDWRAKPGWQRQLERLRRRHSEAWWAASVRLLRASDAGRMDEARAEREVMDVEAERSERLTLMQTDDVGVDARGKLRVRP